MIRLLSKLLNFNFLAEGLNYPQVTGRDTKKLNIFVCAVHCLSVGLTHSPSKCQDNTNLIAVNLCDPIDLFSLLPLMALLLFPRDSHLKAHIHRPIVKGF